MDPFAMIEKYYKPGSLAHTIMVTHSKAVKNLALLIAERNPQYQVNLPLLSQAAILHDIGIFRTNAPDLGCHGEHPYICHGYLGREILENEGMPDVAVFCERHTGTGITKEEIIRHNLPLPLRDMLPVSIEEKILCYADKFFSKSGRHPTEPKKLERIFKSLTKYGDEKVARFHHFVDMFGIDYIYL